MGLCDTQVIIFLPLPKSLHSGNNKAKNEKRNHCEHYRLTVTNIVRLTVKNVKRSRDTFKPINAMDFSLRYGNTDYNTFVGTETRGETDLQNKG